MVTASERSGIYPARLEIRSVGHILYIRVDEIDWIEAADTYVILHTTFGSHLMRESMNRLETILDPENFLRVHRSTIINLNRVREIRSIRFGDRMVVLGDGTKVRVSRVRKGTLEASLRLL